jgi:AcrR family transcriptional regulator
MKTKERILQKSLELYNEEGLAKVTLRQIAHALGMSQGNLNYHFRTRAEIVSALYYKLVDHMNREIEKITAEQPILSFLYESALATMKGLYVYRFITRDIYSVLDTDPSLRSHYLELQRIRKHQYVQLFGNMISAGLMREEEFEKEYDRLYERMNILGDNWINAAELFRQDDPKRIEHYHSLLFEVIYPYLTPSGKKQYLELI